MDPVFYTFMFSYEPGEIVPAGPVYHALIHIKTCKIIDILYRRRENCSKTVSKEKGFRFVIEDADRRRVVEQRRSNSRPEVCMKVFAVITSNQKGSPQRYRRAFLIRASIYITVTLTADGPFCPCSTSNVTR